MNFVEFIVSATVELLSNYPQIFTHALYVYALMWMSVWKSQLN